MVHVDIVKCIVHIRLMQEYIWTDRSAPAVLLMVVGAMVVCGGLLALLVLAVVSSWTDQVHPCPYNHEVCSW